MGGKQHPCVESKLLVELDALPLEMQDSVLFKTKESEANLPDFSFLTFACVSMNHHYRNKCCQISKEQPGLRQMPIKARKAIPSDIARQRDEYSPEFTLEQKCCHKGLVLSAKELQGRGHT